MFQGLQHNPQWEVSCFCDWSLLALHRHRQAKSWMWMISLTRPKLKILQERIICIEQMYLKSRTFFVLTDCSLHSNFRQGSTQRAAKYKPHYTSCHRSFIDTWGIKKWQRCRDRGCNGTKMCQVETWMNLTVSTARCKSNHAVFQQDDSLNLPAFLFLLENIMACIYQNVNCGQW